MRKSSGMSRAELLELPASIDLVTAGRALGIGRTKAYELNNRGELPFEVLRLGNSYRVVTADLLRVLGVRHEHGESPASADDKDSSPAVLTA